MTTACAQSTSHILDKLLTFLLLDLHCEEMSDISDLLRKMIFAISYNLCTDDKLHASDKISQAKGFSMYHLGKPMALGQARQQLQHGSGMRSWAGLQAEIVLRVGRMLRSPVRQHGDEGDAHPW